MMSLKRNTKMLVAFGLICLVSPTRASRPPRVKADAPRRPSAKEHKLTPAITQDDKEARKLLDQYMKRYEDLEEQRKRIAKAKEAEQSRCCKQTWCDNIAMYGSATLGVGLAAGVISGCAIGGVEIGKAGNTPIDRTLSESEQQRLTEYEKELRIDALKEKGQLTNLDNPDQTQIDVAMTSLEKNEQEEVNNAVKEAKKKFASGATEQIHDWEYENASIEIDENGFTLPVNLKSLEAKIDAIFDNTAQEFFDDSTYGLLNEANGWIGVAIMLFGCMVSCAAYLSDECNRCLCKRFHRVQRENLKQYTEALIWVKGDQISNGMITNGDDSPTGGSLKPSEV